MGISCVFFRQTRSEIRPLIFPYIYASVFLVFALSRYCPILTHPPDFTKTSILQKGGENLLLYLLLKDPPHSERAREREFRGRRGRHFRLSLSLGSASLRCVSGRRGEKGWRRKIKDVGRRSSKKGGRKERRLLLASLLLLSPTRESGTAAAAAPSLAGTQVQGEQEKIVPTGLMTPAENVLKCSRYVRKSLTVPFHSSYSE